jgi:hypothetical protein
MNPVMRNALLACLLLPAAACSSKSSQPSEPPIVKFGVIAEKRDYSQDQVESGSSSRGNTSVYGSISSGGRVSIGVGVGVLLGGSSSSKSQPLRYDVDLSDGGQITIYDASPNFEVGDCVRITVYPDEQKHAPEMERSKEGCN